MKFVIHRFETCTSTNDVAREMARAGAPEGTVVVAAEQTAGRGTKGRAWHSARGRGLYVSVILRPRAASIALLPLAAGLAARDAVEATHGLAARLRWPNDVVLDGRKLGGILGESAFSGNVPDYAILGTGLNLDHAEGDFPAELRPSAISILMATGRPADREALLAGLLERTARRAAQAESGTTGAAALVADFESRSAFRPGDPIVVLAGGETLRGAYRGLDADGALLVAVGEAPDSPDSRSAGAAGLKQPRSEGGAGSREPAGCIRRFAAAEIARVL